jgi:hypothetical protein
LTRTPSTLALLGLILALVSPALAGSGVRCQTHHEPTLNRLMTLCDNASKAVSTGSSTLRQWQTPITPPLGKTCTSPWDSQTYQVVLNCR